MSPVKKAYTQTKAPLWHAYPTYQPTLFFTTQVRPGWTPAHRGSYVLLFPSWYRLDVRGVLHRVGLTAIPAERKAATIVKSWQEDLEGLLCRPLEEEMHALRAQLPFTTISQCPCIVPDPLRFFLPDVFVRVGAYLYRTDQRGQLLQALGECSMHTAGAVEDFRRVLRHLTGGGIQEVQIHQRESATQKTQTHKTIASRIQVLHSSTRRKEKQQNVQVVSFPL